MNLSMIKKARELKSNLDKAQKELSKTNLEEYNADCEIEDFDYSLIEQYLEQP